MFGLGQNLTFNIVYWQVFDRNSLSVPNEHFFREILISLEVQRAKDNFSDNPGHNMLELYNALLQIYSPQVNPNSISSIIILEYKLPDELPNDLKYRVLVNIRKISNLDGYRAQCPVFLPGIKLCQERSKNTDKQISKLCSLVQFYWVVIICCNRFVHDCSQTNL